MVPPLRRSAGTTQAARSSQGTPGQLSWRPGVPWLWAYIWGRMRPVHTRSPRVRTLPSANAAQVRFHAESLRSAAMPCVFTECCVT